MKGLPENHAAFVRIVELRNAEFRSKTELENLASFHEIEDKNLVKELAELAIVRLASAFARGDAPDSIKFAQIAGLYTRQVNLSHRTSQSMMLQQYSTPAPIGWLAGYFVGIHESGNRQPTPAFFEPSAGNGMLTIAGLPGDFHVNEVDEVRRSNLESLGFAEVTRMDASASFGNRLSRKFRGILTNPPFGSLGETVEIHGVPIRTLDHLMAIHALDTMRDDGRAAIIIGGLTEWDEAGRIRKGKNRIFFNYLHSRYHVVATIQIDGKKLYSRMGTAFDTRIILIAGRKAEPGGAAPLKTGDDTVVKNFWDLHSRFTIAREMADKIQRGNKARKLLELEAEAVQLGLRLKGGLQGIEGPYKPGARACFVLNTVVPDSMDTEIQQAIARVKHDIGMPLEEYVRQRLGYKGNVELCNALAAEQVDAVAMAIYNIEYRGQGMVIGDQTGIGKGRVAASMIRYGVLRGLHPVFITEKANLFSDLYRDLAAIGSEDLVPFIINSRDAKTHIKDESGEIIYKAPTDEEQEKAFERRAIPSGYDFAMATYSQFNQPTKKSAKPQFLASVAKDNILVLDESHNASGSSNTGTFLQSVVGSAKGVAFLSATFAKRPDNMPIYAMKTAISDANLSMDQLVGAVETGGVALQEIIAAQLVAEGQMIRRERSFEGIEVNYITLDHTAAAFGLEDKEAEHKATFDCICDIMRDIIKFQKDYMRPIVKELDNEIAIEGKEITERGGTSAAGIDSNPYFSKVFQVVNQMLFAIKAESVARLAIKRLEEGKKPVIAFSSTMGSFLDGIENLDGEVAENGDKVRADFASVLQKGLDGVMRITETGHDGSKSFRAIPLEDVSQEGQDFYFRLSRRIKTISSGITISPIDQIVQLIKDAGYSVAEVTGRQLAIQLDMESMQPREIVTPSGQLVTDGKITGRLVRRKKENTNDAFRRFNDHQVDVLLINQSGSTGASAHAIPTERVPAHQVRQRVMIVLQPELDINTEVQKRGRINRTGQVMKPIYDYVSSAIPAEKRLMMMLQKKLKSLDANTSSNQRQSDALLTTDDFLNKYGDEVVTQYLEADPNLNTMIGDPLGKDDDKDSFGKPASMAQFVSGRVAVLSTKDQERFYDDVVRNYKDHVEVLRQQGKYDLEVEVMELQAETIKRNIAIVGANDESVFGDDTILDKVKVRNLRKPFTKAELQTLLAAELGEKTGEKVSSDLIDEYRKFSLARHEEEQAETKAWHERQIAKLATDRSLARIDDADERLEAYETRKAEIDAERDERLTKTKGMAEFRFKAIAGVMQFFHPGRGLNIPDFETDKPGIFDAGVFIGYMIDRNRPNPFTPSAIRLKFAVASGRKMLVLPMSGEGQKVVLAIQGASAALSKGEGMAIANDWDTLTEKKRDDWQTRYIVTGNILQGLSKFKGKLVSYSTKDGQTNKGILMPESYLPDHHEAAEVSVPIVKAIPIIKSLAPGKSLDTNGGVGFQRRDHDRFQVFVPASAIKGAQYYLDHEILGLVTGGIFEKVSGMMRAFLPASRIEDFVTMLQDKFRDSVTLHERDFLRIKDELPKRKPRETFVPPSLDDGKAKKIRKLELEAEAVILQLKLRKAA